MPEILRLYVSTTRDLDDERALIGRAIADVPVKIGIEIRRAPALTSTLDEIFERIANVDRFYFLMGNDISAPAGLEWTLAWQLERSVLAMRHSPRPTPAGQEFQRMSPLPWTDVRAAADLARSVSMDVANMLQHPANRYGLTLHELEQLGSYIRRLRRTHVAEVAEPGGAEGGGVLLDEGRPRTGARRCGRRIGRGLAPPGFRADFLTCYNRPMTASRLLPTRLGLLSLLVLSVFAWAPALYPGYWQGLEGFRPVFQALQPGLLASTATTPDLWRGVGSAAFLLAQPFLLLGFTSVEAVRATFVLTFLLGGCGMYTWVRPRFGDLSAGLTGILYMMMPIFLATVYIRGSVADAMILALLPLALAGLRAYTEERSFVGAAVAILSIVWMWRVQAGLAALALVFLTLYVLMVERHWVAGVVVLVAGAAGFASNIPELSLTAAPPVAFLDHFIYLYQLFAVGWRVGPSIPGWQDQFPFQLGFAAITFSVATLWGWWLLNRGMLLPIVRRQLVFAYVGTILLLFLSLNISAPLWSLTNAAQFLTYPWQILLLATPLLALTAGALPELLPDLRAPAYWTALVTLAILSSYTYLTTDYTQVTPPPQPVAMIGDNQLAILSADITEKTEPATATLRVTWQVLRPMDFDDNIFFQAIVGDGRNEQVVAQLDAQPLGDEYPATQWQPGQILNAAYSLDLANAPIDQPLRYYFGFYNWQDGQRLPVDSGLDDKLVLHGN